VQKLSSRALFAKRTPDFQSWDCFGKERLAVTFSPFGQPQLALTDTEEPRTLKVRGSFIFARRSLRSRRKQKPKKEKDQMIQRIK
jgi:hypothetical protein